MPNDCPNFRPVIPDFVRDALVLQVKLMMLYISCHQKTTKFLSWRARVQVFGFNMKMTILGCCHMYPYLNEFFECSTDDLEMDSMKGDHGLLFSVQR